MHVPPDLTGQGQVSAATCFPIDKHPTIFLKMTPLSMIGFVAYFFHTIIIQS